MASSPIQNPSGWLNILTRLGITGAIRWTLSDSVIPVALVDSEVTLAAQVATPLVGVPASAGEVAAPLANTRLADTGPLPAGAYSMTFWIGDNETAASLPSFRLRRRNAADNADIWAFRFALTGSVYTVAALRLLLAINERVVIENVGAANVGTTYQASIFAAAG